MCFIDLSAMLQCVLIVRRTFLVTPVDSCNKVETVAT